MALFPGFGNGCWACLALPLAAVLGIVWLWVVVQGRRAGVDRLSLRRVLVLPALVVMTVALLYFQIPLRIGFAAARTGFQSHAAAAPPSDWGGKWLGKVGIYQVDAYAADPRGGVYFRTGTAQDGMGPDLMSYGFAYRPNPTGTPFGRARYRMGRLTGDWYWFAASDDY
jgi:hypothetical protein